MGGEREGRMGRDGMGSVNGGSVRERQGRQRKEGKQGEPEQYMLGTTFIKNIVLCCLFRTNLTCYKTKEQCNKGYNAGRLL